MQTAQPQRVVVGNSTTTAIDPVNRKATRTFHSLFRRRKLRHLSSTGLFTPGFVRFCSLNLKENW